MNKKITKKMLVILLCTLFCGCANNVMSSDQPGNAAEVFAPVTEECQTPPDTQEANDPYGLGFEFNKLYRYADVINEFQSFESMINSELDQKLNEINRHFQADLSKNLFPETITNKSFVFDSVFSLPLSKTKYSRVGGGLKLAVEYEYNDTAGFIKLKVDSETLGEKYYFYWESGDISSTRENSETVKTDEELLEIANSIIVPRLKKLGVGEKDFHVKVTPPRENQYPYYVFYYDSNDDYVYDATIADIDIDRYGVVQRIFVSDQYILSDEFRKKIPSADYITLMANECRDIDCDCKVTFDFKAFRREYRGMELLEVIGSLKPDNDNPQTHHHSQIEYALVGFFVAKD